MNQCNGHSGQLAVAVSVHVTWLVAGFSVHAQSALDWQVPPPVQLAVSVASLQAPPAFEPPTHSNGSSLQVVPANTALREAEAVTVFVKKFAGHVLFTVGLG